MKTVRKRWTEQEDAILREFYPKELVSAVAKRLGRGKASVMRHANKLGLRCLACDNAKWTNDEIDKLKELYPQMPIAEIAKQLGRGLKSIYKQLHDTGLYRKAVRCAGYIKKRDFFNVQSSEVGIPTSACIQAVKKKAWNGETDTIGRETGMILKPGCEFVEWFGLKQAVNE
jgi:hypothetical protein